MDSDGGESDQRWREGDNDSFERNVESLREKLSHLEREREEFETHVAELEGQVEHHHRHRIDRRHDDDEELEEEEDDDGRSWGSSDFERTPRGRQHAMAANPTTTIPIPTNGARSSSRRQKPNSRNKNVQRHHRDDDGGGGDDEDDEEDIDDARKPPRRQTATHRHASARRHDDFNLERDDDSSPPSHHHHHRRPPPSSSNEHHIAAFSQELATVKNELASAVKLAMLNEAHARETERRATKQERKIKQLEKELRVVREALPGHQTDYRTQAFLLDTGGGGGSAATDYVEPLRRIVSNSSSSSTLRTSDSHQQQQLPWGPSTSSSMPFQQPRHKQQHHQPYQVIPPAPFLLGTSTSESLNAYARRQRDKTSLPGPVVNARPRVNGKPFRDRRKLELEIIELNDEYRALLRDGAARTRSGLERLRHIVQAIEDKEQQLRAAS